MHYAGSFFRSILNLFSCGCSLSSHKHTSRTRLVYRSLYKWHAVCLVPSECSEGFFLCCLKSNEAFLAKQNASSCNTQQHKRKKKVRNDRSPLGHGTGRVRGMTTLKSTHDKKEDPLGTKRFHSSVHLISSFLRFIHLHHSASPILLDATSPSHLLTSLSSNKYSLYQMAPSYKVLIAGAGIGGATLAVLLERANVDYLLFESSPTTPQQGIGK